MTEYPFVSIIVPCYNEQATIRLLLEAIRQQDYPLESIEVVIADGMSIDHTRQEINQFCADYLIPRVRVVDNPKRIIPAAVNQALAAARGEILVRMDAHAVPATSYVRRCVEALLAGKGESVGGVWMIRPRGEGWIARAIAVAAAHPLGVGDAQYRYTRQAQWVDTVPFGAFRRTLVEQLTWPVGSDGPFDESLLTNEDYEFNVRVRQAGGRIWLDPEIRSAYFARRNLIELGRQYARYGYWKFRMLRRYPATLRWRQALPPVFVLAIILLGFLSPLLWLARWTLVLLLAIYGLVLFASGLQLTIHHKDLGFLFGVPAAIAVMHIAWGGGFLWSLVKWVFARR